MAEKMSMIGGTGAGSYYEFNQSLESNLNEFYWPKLSHAIASAWRKLLINVCLSPCNNAGPAACFTIADFGCSCASNTIRSMQFIAKCVFDQASAQSRSGAHQLHIQAFFNDLPSNDFNTLFTLLSSSQLNAAGLNFMPCGLPGSFYTQLFPSRYLHIGLCTLSLHILSMVPKAVQNPNSPAWNKNGIWILEGCKAETALEYKKQFEKDFTCFLQQRSQELIPGGLIFCVMLAAEREPSSSRWWRPNKLYKTLQTAWRQLVSEGILEQGSLDGFNLPIFMPTEEEVKEVVAGAVLQQEFEVGEVQYVKMERAPEHVWREEASADAQRWGRTRETMVRNFVGSLIKPHLGAAKFEVLMERVRELAAAEEPLSRTSLIGVIVLALSRR